MNPNYRHSLTFYHYDKATKTWTRTALMNCSYKMSLSESQNGTNQNKSADYMVRVPESVAITADIGDLIIYGTVTDSITGVSPNTVAEILEKYKPSAFRVKSFADNTGYPGGHYRIGG